MCPVAPTRLPGDTNGQNDIVCTTERVTSSARSRASVVGSHDRYARDRAGEAAMASRIRASAPVADGLRMTASGRASRSGRTRAPPPRRYAEEVFEEVGHALVSRRGWTQDGEWIPIAFVDEASAELLFRHKVIRLLQVVGLLSEERTELLLSWRHSGFSVHNSVRVEPEDQPAVERLARYIKRPPISLERMAWDGVGEVSYRRKRGRGAPTSRALCSAESVPGTP